MMQRLAIVLMLFAASAGSAAAGPILSIEGLPGAYSPGDTLNLTVRLDGAMGLSAYTFDVVVQGTNVENLVTLAATDPTSPTLDPDYIFQASDGFFANPSTVLGNPNEIRLTFADSTLTPVNTGVGGVGTLVAHFTVQISSSFSGNLRIGLDDGPGAIILDGNTGPIDGYDDLLVTPSQTGGGAIVLGPNVVPAPPAIVLSLTGLVSLGGWFALRGRRHLKTTAGSMMGDQ